MENELRCVAGGRVKAVHAVIGQAVEKGALLVEIE
jgi:biotin carboxyl carrier protein